MRVTSLTVGAFAANCHFIVAPDGSALVVDPGDDAPQLIDSIVSSGWRPVAYLLTHGHMDHVSALARLARRYPAPIGLHADDAAWAFTERNAFPPCYGIPEAPDRIDRYWAEGQEWVDAGLRYRVLFTPGHSPGGVCFYFPEKGVLIAGDTLFAGSIGRTDLPGGDAKRLDESLRRIATLPPETRVYCGHGGPTTLAQELRSNPYLRVAIST